MGPAGLEEPPQEAARASTLLGVQSLISSGGAQPAAGVKPVAQRAPPRPQVLPGEWVADPVAPPRLRLRRPPLGLRLLPGAGSRCLSRGAEGTPA